MVMKYIKLNFFFEINQKLTLNMSEKGLLSYYKRKQKKVIKNFLESYLEEMEEVEEENKKRLRHQKYYY
jgi:hypothetical protein